MRLQFLSTLLYIIATISLTMCDAKSVEEMFLEPQNEARSQVRVPPLTWNNTLATFAQKYVDKIKVTCSDVSGSGGPYGENIAAGYGAETIEFAVGQWIGEKDNYDHNTNTCKKGKECKHYTQVVWRYTHSVGCANIVCGAGWPVVVCEYFPPGNLKGQSPY